MSWDLDAMSVLPEKWQEEVVANFTPEFLAEKLSDYVSTLENKVKELELGEASAANKVIELEASIEEMHSQVSGYLKGSDWEHWQKFNADKFRT